MTVRVLLAVAVFALTLAGCGGSSGPSVAACTKAYPAWFAASASAGKTTPVPPGCKGLSDAQITAIATAYLAYLAKLAG